MKKTTFFAVAVGAAAMLFAASAHAQADDSNDGTNPATTGQAFVDNDGDGINDNVARMHQGWLQRAFARHQRRELRGLTANLTDEQKAEIRQTIDEMRAQGAARDAIHSAVGEKLQSFGITLPEDWNQMPEQFAQHRALARHQGHELRGLRANLTDEQKAELRQTFDDMRAQGATREQIHAAVGEKLQSFGVTLPDDWNLTPEEFAAQRRLSPEQRDEVHSLVQSMRAEGKTRDEIRTAIEAKYQEWGKAMPEGRLIRRGSHGRRMGSAGQPQSH